MSSTTSASSADRTEGATPPVQTGPCPHAATTLCHGTLRWACDDCGLVSAHHPSELRSRLAVRLEVVREHRGGYNRRHHDVA